MKKTKPKPKPKPCPYCNGYGENFFKGTICLPCNGKGTIENEK